MAWPRIMVVSKVQGGNWHGSTTMEIYAFCCVALLTRAVDNETEDIE